MTPNWRDTLTGKSGSAFNLSPAIAMNHALGSDSCHTTREANGVAERMPMEVLRTDDSGYLTLRASGILSRDDYQSSLSDISSALQSHGGGPVLLDWSSLQGWGDDSEDAYAFHAWLDNARLLGRVAILSSGSLEEHVAWFLEFARARNIEAEAFRPEKRDAAIAWLLSKN